MTQSTAFTGILAALSELVANGLTSNPLTELAVALGIAALAGSLFSYARQTPIPAYLLAGAVVGPAGLSVISRSDLMSVLAEIGVVVMLFLVGVKLDLRILARVGRAALLAGTAQILIVGMLGFGFAFALGLPLIERAYVALAVAISSTVVVVTILGQRKELDALHGKLSVSLLILQDIIAILALFVLPALGGSEGASEPLASLGKASLRLLAFFAVATVAYSIFSPLSAAASRSAETSFVFLVSWTLAIAVVGLSMGVGAEAGAFTAGVMVSTAKHGHLAASRLAGVRDFLVPFFFLSIGSQVIPRELGKSLLLVVGLVVTVVIIKPVVTFAAFTWFRYGARSSALAALSLGQTSEFSLLLVAAGSASGQISAEVRSALVSAVFGSFLISSLLTNRAASIYEKLESILERFEREGGEFNLAQELDEGGKFPSKPVVIFGMGRIGGVLLDRLRHAGIPYLAFDFDPATVKSSRKSDPFVYFGDAEDPDLFEYLDLDAVKIVVSTVRNEAVSRKLIEALRSNGFRGRIVVAATDDEESLLHAEKGADLVLVPYRDAADLAATAVCEALALRPPSLLFEEIQDGPGTDPVHGKGSIGNSTKERE